MRIIITLLVLGISLPFSSSACSACKITINGKTYFGNNEDSWRLGSGIWFEPGGNGKLGAAYFGYNHGFPQGALNEAGLAYDGLTIETRKTRPGSLPIIDNPTSFLKEIMQRCHNVDEVLSYASRFRREGLNSGLIFFTDRNGKYLAMEPDTMIVGNDPAFVIANFCLSDTNEKQRARFGRYSRGKQFISNKMLDASSILSLVDTMHECRARKGDGTIYSYTADLDQLKLNVYFYHDYKEVKSFDLKQELAKGEHAYDFASLFSPKAEYVQLVSYKTPYTDVRLGYYLLLSAALFGMSIIWWIWQTRKQQLPLSLGSSLIFLNILLVAYMYVLIMHQGVYFFPAPYKSGTLWIDALSYLPYAMIIFIPAIAWLTYKNRNISALNKAVVGINFINYIFLFGFFVYWGLLNF